jgi:haloalkane dehalogenase
MAQSVTKSTWPDRTLFPFTSRFLELDAGRIHYVDEGSGPPVVMVHGTPDWSFLYREPIRRLADRYRCLALDHLGFGLSDKPRDWSYRIDDHARNFASFVEQLGLERFTLVVHDFGGPIGLAYAIDHPERIERLVIANTWMWSLQREAQMRRVLALLGGPIGRLLYEQLNISTKVIIPNAWGTHRPLTKEVHRQYVDAAPHPRDRYPMWCFAREGLAGSAFYEDLWLRRERIREIPALILWGVRDPAFKPHFADRFAQLFQTVRVIRYPDVGHFVPDEAGPEVAEEIARFLG